MHPRVTQVVEALTTAGPQREAVAALLERQQRLHLGTQQEITREVMKAIKSVRRFGDLRTSMPNHGTFTGDRRVT